MNPTPRFCTQCGAPLAADARFCGQCGSQVRRAPQSPEMAIPQAAASPASPVVPQQPAAPMPAPAPASPARRPPFMRAAPAQPQGEPALSITPGLTRSKGFLGMGRETFTLLTTPTRLVFAYLDPKVMNQLVAEARSEAKSEGKGFFGQWGAQLGWLNLLVRRYQAMTADAVLAQTPGSFFIPNTSVKRVRVRQISTDSESTVRNQTQIIIDTTNGKHKFDVTPTMGISARELKQRLQQVLGTVVK